MSHPRLYRVEAIVIKRRNIGEADRLVTLFSKERGKITALAKGIRRISSRRAPHLEIFSRGKMLLHRGHHRDIVSEIEPIASYANLRKDLERVSLAYYLCEIIDVLLPEQQEHRDVYGHLVGALSTLNGGDLGEEFLPAFTQRLLVMLGFLAPARTLTEEGLMAYVEQLAERRLKTKNLIQFFYGSHG